MTQADLVDRSYEMSRRALALLQEHRLSANPRNYAVCYTYVSDANKGLKRAFDEHLAGGAIITQAALDAIHDEFFSTKASEDAMMEFGKAMSEEIAAVQKLLRTTSQDTASYGSTLEGVSGQLAKGGDPAIMKVVVDQLVGATKKMVARSRGLESRLRQSTDEIAKLKANIEVIRLESLTDELTNLPNRRAFDDAIAKAAEHARDKAEPLVLLMGDIDHFKRFNDTWGHQTGDQVLRLVAHCMRESVREKDIPARYGGEEFGVILPAASLETALTIAERIRKNVESKRVMKRSTGEDLGTITLSLGAAIFKPGEEIADLIKRADACLYAAKRAGRNRVIHEHEIDPTKVLEEAAVARARKAAG